MPAPQSILLPPGARAAGGRQIGQVYPDAPAIVAYGDVINQLVEYSSQDMRRETGAFLLGMHHEGERPVVEIRHFLPASDTRSAAGSLTFTHDTWSALAREAARQFPDEEVVGWHHTHPGFGVFLSPHDRFIHQHFFSRPWEIALVVDPQRCEFGFFQWRQGDLTDCGFVCISPR